MLSSASFLAIIVSCAKIDDVPVLGGKDQKQNIDFDIMVNVYYIWKYNAHIQER